MTALAGCVAWHQPRKFIESRCQAILAGQLDYSSSKPTITAAPGAALGMGLFEMLPEDSLATSPIASNERFLLIADIRLDNRAEMLSVIGQSELRPLTDSQIILEAWSRQGEATLNRMIGDYALAVFDKAERTLTLARDETGQRPLFYCRSEESVAFASMASGILNDPSCNQGWNLRRVGDLFQGFDLHNPETYFAGISRLLPGEVIRFSMDAIRKRFYWNPLSGLHAVGFSEAVEQYRYLLDMAVQSRVRRRSGRVALHLSSGYDSSAIAASAATLEPAGHLLAYTAAPCPAFHGEVLRGRHADESKLAALTARQLGLNHRVIRATDLTLDYLRREAVLYQDPLRNIINSLWGSEIQRRARDEGATVLLNGMLGNVTLNSGGPVYLSEWLRQRGVWQWWPQAKAARRDYVRWRGVLFASFAPFLPFSLWSLINRTFRPVLNDPEPFIQAELRLSSSQLSHRAFGQPKRSSAEDRLHFISAIDPGIFYKGGLADHGLAESEPLADRRIIEFSLALTPEQLICDGESRPVAKAAMKHRLPAEVLYPKQRGMQSADWEHHFKQASAFAILEEIETCPTAREVLDLRAMRSAIADWPADAGGNAGAWTIYASRLPTALSTGVFLKETERRWNSRSEHGPQAALTSNSPSQAARAP